MTLCARVRKKEDKRQKVYGMRFEETLYQILDNNNNNSQLDILKRGRERARSSIVMTVFFFFRFLLLLFSFFLLICHLNCRRHFWALQKFRFCRWVFKWNSWRLMYSFDGTAQTVKWMRWQKNVVEDCKLNTVCSWILMSESARVMFWGAA